MVLNEKTNALRVPWRKRSGKWQTQMDGHSEDCERWVHLRGSRARGARSTMSSSRLLETWCHFNINNDNHKKLIQGTHVRAERGENLTSELLMKGKDGCYKAQPKKSLHCSGLHQTTEISLRRQSICLEATLQEDAECGKGWGGNKSDLGQQPPWPHNSKKH